MQTLGFIHQPHKVTLRKVELIERKAIGWSQWHGWIFWDWLIGFVTKKSLSRPPETNMEPEHDGFPK